MNKKTIITILLALVAMTGLAQKHLPAFQYSKEPAVLSGQIIGNNQQITESVHVRYVLKYTSGTGDALRQASAAVDACLRVQRWTAMWRWGNVASSAT